MASASKHRRLRGKQKMSDDQSRISHGKGEGQQRELLCSGLCCPDKFFGCRGATGFLLVVWDNPAVKSPWNWGVTSSRTTWAHAEACVCAPHKTLPTIECDIFGANSMPVGYALGFFQTFAGMCAWSRLIVCWPKSVAFRDQRSFLLSLTNYLEWTKYVMRREDKWPTPLFR